MEMLAVSRPWSLKGYFVRITQCCEFQNYVRGFLSAGFSLNLSDDFIILGEKSEFHHKCSGS